MNLSDPKLLELAKKHPVVQDLITIVESYESDPAKVFYVELKEMVKALSEEMAYLRAGNKALCSIITGDDKVFERIKGLMTDSEKIFAGLKKGAGDEDQEETGRHKKDKRGDQVVA